MDDASLLHNVGLYDFNPHSEVYRFISKKDLHGGPFFTKAMYDVMEHTIRHHIAQCPETKNSPLEMISCGVTVRN
jgi:hypothetical protein